MILDIAVLPPPAGKLPAKFLVWRGPNVSLLSLPLLSYRWGRPSYLSLLCKGCVLWSLSLNELRKRKTWIWSSC